MMHRMTGPLLVDWEAVLDMLSYSLSVSPVVGVAGENHRRPVELFGQHRAEQHMRPCGAAEGDPGLGTLQQLLRMAVGAADGAAGRRAAPSELDH